MPFAPGGSNDIIARVLATKLGARLGQPVIVENKGGAGGTIGTDYVAKSPPDGNTLLFVSTSITTNAASGKQLPYDLLKDLQPIGEVAAGAFVVVVSNDLKVTTLKEFIDLARAKPNSISYGSAGIGGINHLGTELLRLGGEDPARARPVQGHRPGVHRSHGRQPADGAAHHRLGGAAHPGGKDAGPGRDRRAALAARARAADRGRSRAARLRARSVVGHRRPRQVAGSGAQAAQRGVERRARAARVREVLAREGAEPRPSTPEEFGKLISADLTRWSKLIKDTNIKVE